LGGYAGCDKCYKKCYYENIQNDLKISGGTTSKTTGGSTSATTTITSKTVEGAEKLEVSRGGHQEIIKKMEILAAAL
jgi:hypothetical protein